MSLTETCDDFARCKKCSHYTNDMSFLAMSNPCHICMKSHDRFDPIENKKEKPKEKLIKVSLTQAIAECYNFNDKKTRLIKFCIKWFKEDKNSHNEFDEDQTTRFGKQYDLASKTWEYFVNESRYVPTFQSNEEHFIQNLFNSEKMRKKAIYSAQCGQVNVFRMEKGE